MKHLLLFLLLPVFMVAQADKSVIPTSQWLTNYDTAIEQSKKSDKNVLVYFTGSDWCPPCKMLKTDLFDSAEFSALSSHYVLLYIDIPMNRNLISKELLVHNKELSDKLNKKGSVPLITILNETGKVLDKYAGYSMNGNLSDHLELLQKHKSISK